MSGNEDSAAYDGRTRLFSFPQPDMVPTIVNDRSLCRRTGCGVCARAPEFIPVHCECYEVYVQESTLDEDEALSRLWVAGAWRSPWSKAPLVHLQTAPIDRDALEGMADVCGMPLLSKLPMEILETIRGFSRHGMLWRSVVVRGLAARLSATSREQLVRVPLSAVSSWEPGGQLIRASSDCPPWVRITIDTDGISKVERLFAVDLNRIRGLTFFFIWGAPYGVHVHRSEESCAMDTCERFPNRTRLGLVWVYLPVAAEDRVLVLGTRKTELGPSILVGLSARRWVLVMLTRLRVGPDAAGRRRHPGMPRSACRAGPPPRQRRPDHAHLRRARGAAARLRPRGRLPAPTRSRPPPARA